MKMFHKSYDGGADSGVTGYWLIESKRFFSIVLLNFSPGSRDAFHSHAFNAVTWWLKGKVVEYFCQADKQTAKVWTPSLWPKFTPKSTFHKIFAQKTGAWALSFRGPWDETWQEHKNGETYSLSSGRVRVEENYS